MKSCGTMAAGKTKIKILKGGIRLKAEGPGRKYQADRNKVGWEAGSKSIQRDGIKAEECHGTRLLILDSLTAS